MYWHHPSNINPQIKKPRSVALLGADYHGLKPFLLVKEGDNVNIGQALLVEAFDIIMSSQLAD